MSACVLCLSNEVNNLLFGDFHEGETFRAHEFCLFLTSNLCQNGKSGKNEGILGFLENDILNEVKRCKKLKCFYCHKRGANIGCCKSICRRTYHTNCGFIHGAQYLFSSSFESFCDLHRHKHDFRPKKNEQCVICLNSLFSPPLLTTTTTTAAAEAATSKSTHTSTTNKNQHDYKFNFNTMLHAPCCRNGWYHKECIQRYANSSGYFFKCPLCNDSDNFRSVNYWGIFIPDRDAEWEREPNAYEELDQRETTCVAKSCLIENRHNNDIYCRLLYCELCGSKPVHLLCNDKNINYTCNDCKSLSITNNNNNDSDSDGFTKITRLLRGKTVKSLKQSNVTAKIEVLSDSSDASDPLNGHFWKTNKENVKPNKIQNIVENPRQVLPLTIRNDGNFHARPTAAGQLLSPPCTSAKARPLEVRNLKISVKRISVKKEKGELAVPSRMITGKSSDEKEREHNLFDKGEAKKKVLQLRRGRSSTRKLSEKSPDGRKTKKKVLKLRRGRSSTRKLSEGSSDEEKVEKKVLQLRRGRSSTRKLREEDSDEEEVEKKVSKLRRGRSSTRKLSEESPDGKKTEKKVLQLRRGRSSTRKLSEGSSDEEKVEKKVLQLRRGRSSTRKLREESSDEEEVEKKVSKLRRGRSSTRKLSDGSSDEEKVEKKVLQLRRGRSSTRKLSEDRKLWEESSDEEEVEKKVSKLRRGRSSTRKLSEESPDGRKTKKKVLQLRRGRSSTRKLSEESPDGKKTENKVLLLRRGRSSTRKLSEDRKLWEESSDEEEVEKKVIKLRRGRSSNRQIIEKSPGWKENEKKYVKSSAKIEYRMISDNTEKPCLRNLRANWKTKTVAEMQLNTNTNTRYKPISSPLISTDRRLNLKRSFRSAKKDMKTGDDVPCEIIDGASSEKVLRKSSRLQLKSPQMLTNKHRKQRTDINGNTKFEIPSGEVESRGKPRRLLIHNQKPY